MWEKQYSEDLTAEEKSKSTKAVRAAVDQLGLAPLRTWGELIEDRGTQITYSALGQEAPIDAKLTWDPDFAKRKRIKKLLDQQLPDLSVHLGGATSVDITKPGIDKAYGIHKLQELLKIEMTDILFIGDALFDGGNDAPVRQMGIDTVQVASPSVTQSVMEGVLACLNEPD
jgi:HAD superfamily hydrolase (TIGR01484 family)